MSDYSTTATVTIDVNGTQAENKIQKQKELVHELERAYSKLLNSGDPKTIKKAESELKKARRELKSMQTEAANVADVLNRLDKATPKELKSTLRSLYAQLEKLERGTEEWVEKSKQIKRVKAELESVNNTLKNQESRWQRLNRTLQEWQTFAVAGIAAIMQVVGTARKAVESYAAMEQEMANVRKYTGMTAEQVQDLNEEFKKMDTRTSREGLNQLAQEAGRLGKTSKEDILGFVRASDQINVALDDLGEGATLTLSKLTGIFGDEQRLGTEKALLSVGSVINDLSQNCTASAPYLAEFASRMGGVGSQAGLTIPQIMAFGAVLDSNNQKVEASATAVSQVITRLYQDPAKYAKSAGLDVQAFSTLVKTDMNQALITLLERLNSLGNMDVLAPIFKDMGENGSRAISALSTLAGKIEEVKTQQDVAAQSYAEATSITKEYNVQNNTVQAGLDKAKKRFAELSIELGEKLLPLMKYAITTSSAIVRVLSVLVGFVVENWRVIVTLTSAIVAYNIAVNASIIKTKLLATWQGIVKATTIAWTAVTQLASAAIALFSGNITKATTAFKAFSATLKLSPIGALIGLVTAVGTAITLAMTKTDEYTKALKSATAKTTAFMGEAMKEQRELDILFGKLEGAKEGTEDFNTIRDTIISKYGTYLQGLIDENGQINDLEAAYNRLTTAIRKNAQEKGIEAARTESTEAYTKKTTDLLNTLQTHLEIFGADARKAAELTQAVASSIISDTAIPDEILNELSYWSGQKPFAGDAEGMADFFHRAYANSIIAPPGVGYLQPNEIVNQMYAAQEEYNKNIANIDALADGINPLKKHSNRTIETAIESLKDIINSGESGIAVLVTDVADVLQSSQLSVSEAEKELTKYTEELASRIPTAKKHGKKTIVENDDTLSSDENLNKFEKEEKWRDEQNLRNRIAYATGKEDYEKFISEQERIELEYYNRCLARTDLTNIERLTKEAEYHESVKKYTEDTQKREQELQKKNTETLIQEENRRYNEAVAFEKQRYIDGKTSLESHNNTLALMELDHKRNLVNCTKEGTKERLDAEKAYSDALLADQLSRHNEYLKNQEKHEKELAKIKSSIFGLSDQEKLAAYEIDLANLTEVYDREVKAVGNNKNRLLEIEEAFQIAKLALKQKYDQQINSADLTARQKMQMSAQKQLEWFNSEQGKAFTGSVDFAASTISSMTSALSSLVQAEADKEIATIEAKYDAEIAAAGDNSAKVAELEKKKEAEIAKVKSEASKKQFKMQVLQAVAQMAQGAINAYSSAAAIPVVGFVMAPIAAAMAIAAGMIQIATLKKQQQAAEAQGYAEGGYTKKGSKYEPAGIVHAGEWVASQKLLADPTAKAMIDRLDYAQRTNTIGSLSQSAVSRTITAPAEMVASATQESVTRTLAAQTVALNNFNSSMATLNTRLNEPFVTVNTVTGDNGIKKVQDEYDKLIKNKSKK